MPLLAFDCIKKPNNKKQIKLLNRLPYFKLNSIFCSLSLKVSETWRKIIFKMLFLFVCLWVWIPILTLTLEQKVVESLFLCQNVCIFNTENSLDYGLSSFKLKSHPFFHSLFYFFIFVFSLFMLKNLWKMKKRFFRSISGPAWILMLKITKKRRFIYKVHSVYFQNKNNWLA